MGLPRSFTNVVNYTLDNIMPPILRDSKTFMSIFMRLTLGKKYKAYMDFKEKCSDLLERDIESYYENLADTVVSRHTDLNKKCINFILKNLVGDSVADIGCGRGFLLNTIYQNHDIKTIHGLDFCTPREKYTYYYTKGHVTKLPYEDNSFDTVICAHVLEHIRDIRLGLSELKRVAKKRIIIVLPKQRFYKYTFDLHIHFFPYKFCVVDLLSDESAKVFEIGGDWVAVLEGEISEKA